MTLRVGVDMILNAARTVLRASPTRSVAPTAPRRASHSASPPSNSILIHRHGSLLLKCTDSIGIVSAVADAVLKNGCNMTGADLHVEKGTAKTSESEEDTFVCRFSFEPNSKSHSTYGNNAVDVDSFEKNVMEIASKFHAEASLLHQTGRLVLFDGATTISPNPTDGVASRVKIPSKIVARPFGPARMGILLSSRDHCVLDLLNKCRSGDLPITIPYVISNHNRSEESSHVHRSLSRLDIPYYFVETNGKDREEWETDIRNIVESRSGEFEDGIKNPTDFLVLARYMQILSPSFLTWYAPKPIINIHHGLLPSFKGSNPYRQAYDAGVKLIGATAHFVTDELDEGPIIEQRVARVSHRDTVRMVRIKSETLEANALHDAVRYYAENRVVRIGGRTIVFT